MGGNIEYKTESYISATADLDSIAAKETKNIDLIQKLKGIVLLPTIVMQLKS